MTSFLKPWFEYPALISNFIVDLVVSELNSVRHGLPNNHSKSELKELGDGGLGADSLELINLSTALARAIHIHESQIEDNFLADSTFDAWRAITKRSLSIYSQKISFKTSGSTGLKKYCEHYLTHLEEEAKFLASLFIGRKRILRAVPSHHIYGFIFSVLLPRYLGVEVIDIRFLSINALNNQLQAGDLILGFPEFWYSVNQSGVRFSDDIVGINSTGPCPQEIGLGVLALNLTSFYEVFGSSETAGVGWRDHPINEYTLFPFWEKTDVESQLIRQGADVTLQDKLEWSSDRRFKVIGRKDGIVQIGGNNVSLNHVRELLVKHPLIKDAAVRLMRPEEGVRLKAFIVPTDHAIEMLTTEKVEVYINAQLKPVERPKSIIIGGALPINDLGKPCDWIIPVSLKL